MKDMFLQNKKKIIAALLALILAVAGINLSQQTQDTIVDNASNLLPNASTTAPVKTTP